MHIQFLCLAETQPNHKGRCERCPESVKLNWRNREKRFTSNLADNDEFSLIDFNILLSVEIFKTMKEEDCLSLS